MSKDQFRSWYVRYCHEGGHGFDEYDLESNYERYKKFPEEYEWLKEYANERNPSS